MSWGAPGRAIVLGALIITGACSDAGSGAVSGDEITISGVDVPLSFEPEEIEVDAGSYRIVFTNDGQLPHQVALGRESDPRAGDDGDTAIVAGGEDASFEADLRSGRYTYACYVDGHNLAGMVGTLVVR